MIRGFVNSRGHPIVSVELRGPTGKVELVDFLIDTGFTGYLILPKNTIDDLQLKLRSVITLVLADGS